MQFTRPHSRRSFDRTALKEKAYVRKLRRDHQAQPLALALLPMPEPDIDAEFARREAAFLHWQQTKRDAHAADWRRVRALYYGLSPEKRAKVRERYERNWSPRRPEFLNYIIRKLDDPS